jgi:hypothetical protein
VRVRERPATPVAYPEVAPAAILGGMPTPPNERRSLEQELAELPVQMATYRQELADTPTLPEFKARRERLDWQVRNCQKRLAAIRARLAAIVADGG